MTEGFATRPAEIGTAAGRFDEAARLVTDALVELRATLGGLGDYLGDDEQGRTFAAEYDPKAAEGLRALDREAEAVRSLGDGLRSTAHDYRAGENGNAAGLQP